jgi:hypothetical protein
MLVPANAWVESWQMFDVETQALMNLSPNKCANYRRDIRAATLRQSRL